MGTALRILIVEDSADDTELLLWELRRGGYDPVWQRVETAEDMAAALDKQSWDIVIADYVMPRFTGLAALELLQSRELDLPFVIVSGKVGEDAAVEAMRAGAHDYLIKGHLARLVPAVKRELSEYRDRMERKRAEAELYLLKKAIENSMDGMAVVDKDGNLVYVNHAYAEIFGYGTPEELTGKSWQILYGDDEGTKIEREIMPFLMKEGKWRGEAVGKRRDEGTFPQEISLTVIEGGGVICVVRDITERKETEEKLMYMSTHDPLTGFYNRAYFEEEMDRLERSRQFPVSIVMADVDGLKEVNDTQGHAAGDEVLRQAAKVLFSVFRAEDMVARIGGDEFVVLLPEADAAVVENALQRIRETLAETARSLGLTLSLSLGAATATESGRLLEAMKLADERMYRDKLSRSSRESLKIAGQEDGGQGELFNPDGTAQ